MITGARLAPRAVLASASRRDGPRLRPPRHAAPKTAMSQWTEHTSSEGRTFYYDRVSGVSAWSKPETSVPAPKRRAEPLSLMACLDQPAVLGLARAIVRHCGVAALPSVATKPPTDPFCHGGRGGAFCCASKSIYLCEHAWVGCREVAYELSHALNACRGTVRCAPHGVQVDGKDCGYFSPPDVGCST